MDLPETRYAESDGVHIAYQMMGTGPFDLVSVPGWRCNVERMWEEPRYAAFLKRLRLEDHSLHELKGIPGRWRLYRVA